MAFRKILEKLAGKKNQKDDNKQNPYTITIPNGHKSSIKQSSSTASSSSSTPVSSGKTTPATETPNYRGDSKQTGLFVKAKQDSTVTDSFYVKAVKERLQNLSWVNIIDSEKELDKNPEKELTIQGKLYAKENKFVIEFYSSIIAVKNAPTISPSFLKPPTSSAVSPVSEDDDLDTQIDPAEMQGYYSLNKGENFEDSYEHTESQESDFPSTINTLNAFQAIEETPPQKKRLEFQISAKDGAIELAENTKENEKLYKNFQQLYPEIHQSMVEITEAVHILEELRAINFNKPHR